jgi:hypothetical protein
MRVWIAANAVCLAWCCTSASYAASPKKVDLIRRLDGTTMIWSDTVTPWEWEGYTATYIDASRKQQ